MFLGLYGLPSLYMFAYYIGTAITLATTLSRWVCLGTHLGNRLSHWRAWPWHALGYWGLAATQSTSSTVWHLFCWVSSTLWQFFCWVSFIFWYLVCWVSFVFGYLVTRWCDCVVTKFTRLGDVMVCWFCATVRWVSIYFTAFMGFIMVIRAYRGSEKTSDSVFFVLCWLFIWWVVISGKYWNPSPSPRIDCTRIKVRWDESYDVIVMKRCLIFLILYVDQWYHNRNIQHDHNTST